MDEIEAEIRRMREQADIGQAMPAPPAPQPRPEPQSAIALPHTLAPNEMLFVALIVEGYRPPDAAARAYLEPDPARARSIANRLLANEQITAEIRKHTENAVRLSEVSAAKIVKRMWKEAVSSDNPPNVRVRALEILGKWQGLGRFKDDEDANDIVQIRFNKEVLGIDAEDLE